MDLSLPLQIAVLLLLLLLSAFFSLSETAMIGVNRIQVRAKADAGSTRARLLDHMLDEPERILSTVLVGNNVVNIGATAFATVVALELFGARGALIATGAMAVLITVMAEILPKTFAVQKPLPIALVVAGPLRVIEMVFKPVIMFLTWLSRGVARLAGAHPEGKVPFITADEIEMLVRMGVEEGEVDKFEQRVISELFQFTEKDVHKVMTPADKVHFLNKDAVLGAAAELAAKEGRTRILVADGNFEHVMGCVHIRDLLRYTDVQLATLPVTHALRSVLFAPHDMPADRLLVRMQREHKLLAVIQGDGGKNIGICTVEDLLEELVGEIHDEFDAARKGHEQGHEPVHAPPSGAGTVQQR